MAAPLRNSLMLAWLLMVLALNSHASQAAGTVKHWEIEPYRVRAILAVDAPEPQLERRLASYLEARTFSSIGALWRLSVETAPPVVAHRMMDTVDVATERLPEGDAPEDKQVRLTVMATPWGYELAAREYDRYVDRWSPVLRAQTRQREALPEALFALLRRVVAPLAQIRLDTDDPDRVTLVLRGAELPRRSDDFGEVVAGDAFLPVLRRTTRQGELVDDGIQVVPWTYLEAMPASDSDRNRGQIPAQVHSGTSRPLGVRRRGRIEQVAIALRADPAPVDVRLRARSADEEPLVSYEVFSQNTTESAKRLAGRSNRRGEVRVEPSTTPIQMIYVRSGGELLARLPVVAGAQDSIEVPLPNDGPRLRAAARLRAMREDLVDLVARRNIYIARTRRAIEEKEFSRARELLAALDALPGRSQFNLTLEREARLHQADDEQVQQRIDRLFTATQTVLSQFLDPRDINQLHDDLRAAQAEGS